MSHVSRNYPNLNFIKKKYFFRNYAWKGLTITRWSVTHYLLPCVRGISFFVNGSYDTFSGIHSSSPAAREQSPSQNYMIFIMRSFSGDRSRTMNTTVCMLQYRLTIRGTPPRYQLSHTPQWFLTSHRCRDHVAFVALVRGILKDAETVYRLAV